MAVTHDMVSEFVEALKPTETSKTRSFEYGTVVISNGKTYVRIDGSDQLTPFVSTTAVSHDERVTVVIQDHTAVVNGNVSSPSAKESELANAVVTQAITNDFVTANAYIENISGKFADIQTIMAGKVTTEQLEAIGALIEDLKAVYGDFDNLDADKLKASVASVDELYAKFGEFDYLEAEEIEAIKADIKVLRGYTGTFTYLNTYDFSAVKASVDTLKAKHADIAFANIDQASINTLLARSAIIEEFVASEGYVTRELVGVTIKGDLIEAGTLKTDKVFVKGSDGKYYALNTNFAGMPGVIPVEEDQIHGSTIVAKSLTAEKVAVDDLVAFGATVGGFHITDKSLYSGVKSSIDNTTRGIYMDTLGQLHLGDEDSFLKYYCTLPIAPIVKDGVFSIAIDDSLKVSTSIIDGVLAVSTEEVNKIDAKIVDGALDISGAVYKLEISADSVLFGDGSKAEDLKYLTEYIKMGRIEDETAEDGYRPCIELSEGDNGLKQVITNTETRFVDDAVVKTTISKDGIDTENMSVSKELRQSGSKNTGQFIWAVRENGNYGLSWKAVNS